jgi:hypothetical protein
MQKNLTITYVESRCKQNNVEEMRLRDPYTCSGSPECRFCTNYLC